jgi:hypothetical protein
MADDKELAMTIDLPQAMQNCKQAGKFLPLDRACPGIEAISAGCLLNRAMRIGNGSDDEP